MGILCYSFPAGHITRSKDNEYFIRSNKGKREDNLLLPVCEIGTRGIKEQKIRSSLLIIHLFLTLNFERKTLFPVFLIPFFWPFSFEFCSLFPPQNCVPFSNTSLIASQYIIISARIYSRYRILKLIFQYRRAKMWKRKKLYELQRKTNEYVMLE